MSDLRERCREFLSEAQRHAIMRQGSPVDDLMAFVIAERGRSADAALDDTLPLCLYFGTAEDREQFIALFHEAAPNTIAKRMP